MPMTAIGWRAKGRLLPPALSRAPGRWRVGRSGRGYGLRKGNAMPARQMGGQSLDRRVAEEDRGLELDAESPAQRLHEGHAQHRIGAVVGEAFVGAEIGKPHLQGLGDQLANGAVSSAVAASLFAAGSAGFGETGGGATAAAGRSRPRSRGCSGHLLRARVSGARGVPLRATMMLWRKSVSFGDARL